MIDDTGMKRRRAAAFEQNAVAQRMNKTMDDLPKLSRNAFQSFLMVVETGSIRRAAKQLGLAQSALSRQIVAVEEELNVKLLERLTNGIMLTPAGKVFARHAWENKAQLERVRSEMSALHGLSSAAIRMAVQESFASQLIPNCISAFRSKHPGITYRTLIDTMAPVIKAVQDGSADFGILYNLPPSADLKILYSLHDPIVALMRPAHPLASRHHLTVDDLDGTEVALPHRSSPRGSDLEKMLKSLGIVPNIVMETQSVSMLLKICQHTDIVSLVPRIASIDAVRVGRAVHVPLADQIFRSGRIDVFTGTDWPLTAAADAFTRFVQRYVAAFNMDALKASPVDR